MEKRFNLISPLTFDIASAGGLLGLARVPSLWATREMVNPLQAQMGRELKPCSAILQQWRKFELGCVTGPEWTGGGGEGTRWAKIIITDQYMQYNQW